MAKPEGALPVCPQHKIGIVQGAACEWCVREPDLTQRLHAAAARTHISQTVRAVVFREMSGIVRDILDPRSSMSVEKHTTSTLGDRASGAIRSESDSGTTGSKS